MNTMGYGPETTEDGPRRTGMKVYRELNVLSEPGDKASLRNALCEAAVAPWTNAKEREERFRSSMIGADDFIAFERRGGDGPDAGVFMAERPRGYSVPNIVPLETGRLTKDEYNTVLTDFVEAVVEKASRSVPLTYELSSDRQTLEEAIGDEPAKLLKRFSSHANRGTGSSHPSDKRLFQAFILAVHCGSMRVAPDTVERWLVEVDGWGSQVAVDIAIEFEQGIDLLQYYDENR